MESKITPAENYLKELFISYYTTSMGEVTKEIAAEQFEKSKSYEGYNEFLECVKKVQKDAIHTTLQHIADDKHSLIKTGSGKYILNAEFGPELKVS